MGHKVIIERRVMIRAWGRRAAASLSTCLVGTMLAAGAAAPAAAQGDAAASSGARVAVEAVSVDWRTGRPAGWTLAQRMSDDGRMVLFYSEARTLIPDAPRFKRHLYVRDVVRDTISVVTARSDGTPVPGTSWTGMGISGDGRFAAFAWKARGLSPTGKHPSRYAYVKNLRSGHLDAIRGGGSQVTKGQRPYSVSVKAISRHGRYLAGNGAFHGDPWDSVSGYLLDRRTGRWHWICPTGGDCFVEAMSDDGRYVVYMANIGGFPSYFRYDRASGESTPIPRGPISEKSVMWKTVFSGDGRVMVTSWTDNYEGGSAVLVHRTRHMKITEVLGTEEPMSADGISRTGRYLALTANPDQLRWFQTYRYDRRSGEYTLLSVNADGQPANFWTGPSDMSADGSTVLFNSAASNLVPGDRRRGSFYDVDNWDAFVAAIQPPKPPCQPWTCPPPPPR